ncbi:MAG: PilW family protein [Agarilytica sp.]
MKQLPKGFTLTELMVSVALGIILVAGVIEVYSGSRQTYRTQEALARLQENARLAIEILSRDLRMSGNVGCENITNVAPAQTVGLTGMPYDNSFATWGGQRVGNLNTGALSNDAIRTAIDADNIAEDSDILIVQSAGRCSMPLSADMLAADGVITTAANTCSFSDGDYALVSNCSSAGLFRINTVAGGVITPSASVGDLYGTSDGAEVLSFSSNTYFVDDDNGIPSLFVLDNTQAGAAFALIEGVESIQVEYGRDDDDDDIPNRYVDADQAGDFTAVTSVRITLLMRTREENIGSQATTFAVGGTNRTYPAGPLRQQFVTTIGLRNI